MPKPHIQTEWNSAGWFGSQLGGTAWILAAAALAAGRDAGIGLQLTAIFTASNLAGYLLWRGKQLSFHAAMQIQLPISGLSGLLAIYLLHRANLWLEIQHGGAIQAAPAGALLVTIVALLMIVFYLRRGGEDDAPSRRS